MKKDAQLTFRIEADLKRELEAIAASEGRSVAQVCEAFLKASYKNYKKKGTTLLKRFLSQRKPSRKVIQNRS
jgi:predicted HicB family RNase H-like nuclease